MSHLQGRGCSDRRKEAEGWVLALQVVGPHPLPCPVHYLLPPSLTGGTAGPRGQHGTRQQHWQPLHPRRQGAHRTAPLLFPHPGHVHSTVPGAGAPTHTPCVLGHPSLPHDQTLSFMTASRMHGLATSCCILKDPGTAQVTSHSVEQWEQPGEGNHASHNWAQPTHYLTVRSEMEILPKGPTVWPVPLPPSPTRPSAPWGRMRVASEAQEALAHAAAKYTSLEALG